MKKVVILLASVILLIMLAVSCKTSEKCPAYGEGHRFQIEHN